MTKRTGSRMRGIAFMRSAKRLRRAAADSRPFMSSLLWKLGLLCGGVLVVLLAVGMPGLGQGITEPQGELADAECYGHHKQEGFRSMDLFPKVVAEIPKGEPWEFELTIRNPWLHEVQDLRAYVNITDAPGLGFPGERDPEPFEHAGSAQASPSAHTVVQRMPIAVEANATEIVVVVSGEASAARTTPLGDLVGNDFDLRVESPAGEVVRTGPDPATGNDVEDLQRSPTTYEEIHIGSDDLVTHGTGEWTAVVSYRGASQAAYALEATVYYNLSRATQVVLPGPAKLGPGEEHVFTFNLNVRDEAALQALRYGGISTAFHKHTDSNIGDHGLHNKWNTFTFETGSQLVIGSIVVDRGEIDLLSPILRKWGQVLGFASSFLIIPSLVFGGTFGRSTVLKLNDWMGGARRRVLFHNSMSFWLLGLALLHMFLFLYEAFWGWSHGLVWGGLSLACMIGLGITGATQRSFVAKWGFARWRFVHFGMGILVFVFVLIHMVADGSHLAGVRAMFG